jgi:hypothetical protein
MKRKSFVILAFIILVAFLEELTFAQTPSSMRGHRLYRRRGLMNGNLVSTLFWNYCEVGDYPDEPSGCWPSAERHYLDDITLIVSVETKNRDGVTIIRWKLNIVNLWIPHRKVFHGDLSQDALV